MAISKKALGLIKKIIENNYQALLVNVVGRSTLTPSELQRLKDAGYDVSNKASLLSLIYYNNVLNDMETTHGPLTIGEMREQQKTLPKTDASEAVEEHLNENFAQLVEKLKASVQASVEGVVREYNLQHRSYSLQNTDKPKEIKELIRESTIGELKQSLRELTGDSNRDWNRVAITETANAIGLGSLDRVIGANKDKDLNEVYAFRIAKNDSSTCRYCRQFYIDDDGSPAVYRLSTFLNNGSNYGKKPIDWKPVAVANHPNDRESGIIELKPGWKLLPNGKLQYIGPDAWKSYISRKVR